MVKKKRYLYLVISFRLSSTFLLSLCVTVIAVAVLLVVMNSNMVSAIRDVGGERLYCFSLLKITKLNYGCIFISVFNQGINLDNIVKDPTLYGQGNGIGGSGDITSVHPVLEAFQKLNLQLERGQPDFKIISSSLEKIRDECNIDLAHRCLAGNHQAYSSLMKTLHMFSTDISITKAVLQSFCALLNGQPDLLEEDGSSHFVKLLDSFKSDCEILELVVKVIRLCCVKHEINRQTFVGKNVMVLLTELLTLHQSVPSLVKEICFTLRVFTFDDDVRVPFGKAHEHAKMIVTEGCALKAILKICEGNDLF